MKRELTIEEKAKLYDEAKARMSRAFNSNRCTIGFMNEIFPELEESEDEKIRKHIIEVIKSHFSGKDADKCIAYLEKQGNQKPTEWNEKTKGLDELDTYILSIVPNRPLDAIKVDSKNIRFLINKEQKPAIWSEDDELMFISIIQTLELTNGAAQMKIDFLNSLKERIAFKPTSEQIEALEDVTIYKVDITRIRIIDNLCKQLKKLM